MDWENTQFTYTKTIVLHKIKITPFYSILCGVVSMDIIKKYFQFLIAGHTKFLCNACFGLIKNKIFIPSLFDLVQFIKE